jgi:flagellar motor switch protein FliN
MKAALSAILRKLPGMIEGADEIPLFGKAPSFDWDRLSALLAARFEMKDFSVRPFEQVWVKGEDLYDGLGANYLCTPIFLNPLEPPFYFVIPKADKNKLATSMMQGKAKAQISEPLKEGFCRFLILEALSASSALEPIAKFSPSLGEKSKIPEENAFCIDVEISFGEQSCWSRLIFPETFRKAWVAHFAMNPSEYVTSDLAKTTELVLGLECGSVVLSQKEWDDLEPGDFVVLDKGNYDARENTAIALMKIGTIPLFQAKIGKDKMELLDYAFTHEEPMEQNNEAGPLLPAEEESVSIKDLPLNVCVELARLKITLDRLMHLNPGNMIELPIQPDQGVTLTVNGKKVGRAELLYLGESLGIRILELG